MHTLHRPEGQDDLSLRHKLLSPCQQSPHRFTFHHLGESESRRTQREGLRQRGYKKRRRGGGQIDGETDGERNTGLNDKSKERWRSNVEAGWGEVLREREGERKKGVSSNTRHQGEATHYSRSQTSRPGQKDRERRWRASIYPCIHLEKWPMQVPVHHSSMFLHPLHIYSS